MPPNSQSASSALPDEDDNATVSSANMESEDDKSSPDVPWVSRLSDSFALKCSISSKPVRRDPFGTLPWYALDVVLFNLPDLPTLHQLTLASPDVRDYLDDKIGIMPKLVEHIIERREYETKYINEEECDYSQEDADRGLNEDTRIFFRTLVYLWWKEDSVAKGVPSDDNPLPEDFNNPLVYNINITVEGFYEPEKVGIIRLPASTPKHILRHLLSLASRLRRDVHAFFHETMALCASTKMLELKNKKAHWPNNGPRPRGIPHPTCGTRYPLSWIEEQRLMLAFLKPYIFSVLRRVVCEKRLLRPLSCLPDPLPERMYPDTLKNLEQNSLADFWSPYANYGWMRTESMEQMETVLGWLEEGKGSHAIRRKRATKFTTCCPTFNPWTTTQFKRSRSDLQQISLPGPFWAQQCEVVPQSDVQAAGFRGEFQRFGVSFWDMERMEYLGFATKRMHLGRYPEQLELAFRWSSMLLAYNKKAPHWARTKKDQPKKGLKFRSKTQAIPLSKKV
ncbi:hypothetical protein PEX1_004890 [Penicillium expansum]|nr:hypothetical protein PEX1_004890 [Penicillium expansum]